MSMTTDILEKFEFSSFLYEEIFLPSKFENVTWKVVPVRRYTFEHLEEFVSVEIYCSYSYRVSNLWEINAEVDLKVSTDCEHNEIGITVIKNQDNLFDNCSTQMGFVRLLPIRNIILRQNNLQQNLYEKMNFVLNIRIKSMEGLKLIQLSDFSTPENNDSEVVLYVGDNILYANKFALMCFSSKFRDMLSASNEIEIKDIEINIFVVFLRLLYSQKQLINKFNVEDLLSLARKYDVPFLMTLCEEFLRDSLFFLTRSDSRGDVLHILHISEQYEFSELQGIILANLTKDDFKGIPNVNRRMGDLTAKALLKRLCGIDDEFRRNQFGQQQNQQPKTSSNNMQQPMQMNGSCKRCEPKQQQYNQQQYHQQYAPIQHQNQRQMNYGNQVPAFGFPQMPLPQQQQQQEPIYRAPGEPPQYAPVMMPQQQQRIVPQQRQQMGQPVPPPHLMGQQQQQQQMAEIMVVPEPQLMGGPEQMVAQQQPIVPQQQQQHQQMGAQNYEQPPILRPNPIYPPVLQQVQPIHQAPTGRNARASGPSAGAPKRKRRRAGEV